MSQPTWRESHLLTTWWPAVWRQRRPASTILASSNPYRLPQSWKVEEPGDFPKLRTQEARSRSNRAMVSLSSAITVLARAKIQEKRIERTLCLLRVFLKPLSSVCRGESLFSHWARTAKMALRRTATSPLRVKVWSTLHSWRKSLTQESRSRRVQKWPALLMSSTRSPCIVHHPTVAGVRLLRSTCQKNEFENQTSVWNSPTPSPSPPLLQSSSLQRTRLLTSIHFEFSGRELTKWLKPLKELRLLTIS